MWLMKPAPAVGVALSGLLILAVAMGIGRFAFTPLLPMMEKDAGVSIALGGWRAAANYLGYLLGAVLGSGARWLTFLSSQLRMGFNVSRLFFSPIMR